MYYTILDSNFINTFQKYLQYEEIQTRLFNISSTNVQDQVRFLAIYFYLKKNYI